MAFGSHIKMYLTIFIATTCMYMVLYQYHISRQPLPQPDIIKHKDKSIDTESTNGIGGSYTSSSSLSSNKISSSTLASIISSSSSSSSNATNLNAVKLLASNKLTKTSKSSSALTNSFKLLTLPSGTSKLLKSMNIFLWSPMSLLSSSSSSSSSNSNRVISKKPSLKTLALLQQQQEQKQLQHTGKHANSNDSSSLQSSSSSLSKSLLSSSSVMALNNTLLTTSTSSSSTTSTVASTTRLTTSTTTKSKTKQSLAQTTIVNNDKLSAHQQQLLETNLDTPPLYIITPTYRRPEQLAELTRLGYTLKHVANLLWLVIEDANKTSELVLQTLNRIGVPYEYFLAPMPEEYKKTKKAKPRGVSNRNRGLQWLRENATEGVFYFGDDDNTYDISIFEQMRYTKKVSMWPVGLVTKLGVSSPIIKSGKIIGFYDGWIGGRKFPVDMAGFAVSVKFLHERPGAKMPFRPGYEEDGFLKSLSPLNIKDIELLANNCTEILTWHTQTKKNNPADALNMTKYGETNLVLLDTTLIRP